MVDSSGNKSWIRKTGAAMVIALAVLAISVSVQMVSYANSPGPVSSVTIQGESIPQDTDRLELLIPISEEDAAYCLYNEEFEKITGLSPDSEIVTYRDEEGYVSYCAHMKGATCRTWENDLGESRRLWIYDFGCESSIDGQRHLRYIQEQFGSIKVAALDENGAVLRVSAKTEIMPKNRGGYLTSLHYNGTTGKLKAGIYERHSLSGIFRSLLFSLLWILLAPDGLLFHMVLTVIVECATAYLFRIGHLLTVAKVNAFSNLLFNLLMLCAGGSYLPKLIFLELVVVMGEYRFYRKRFEGVGTRHLMAFTLTANIASMVCGMLTAGI